jgi:hypothetical protein
LDRARCGREVVVVIVVVVSSATHAAGEDHCKQDADSGDPKQALEHVQLPEGDGEQVSGTQTSFPAFRSMTRNASCSKRTRPSVRPQRERHRTPSAHGSVMGRTRSAADPET